jgi:hypothetical protein
MGTGCLIQPNLHLTMAGLRVLNHRVKSGTSKTTVCKMISWTCMKKPFLIYWPVPKCTSELFDLVYKYQKRTTDSTTNYLDFWKLDEVYNISGSLRAPDQVLERYGICINLMKKITDEIDQENSHVR